MIIRRPGSNCNNTFIIFVLNYLLCHHGSNPFEVFLMTSNELQHHNDNNNLGNSWTNHQLMVQIEGSHGKWKTCIQNSSNIL